MRIIGVDVAVLPPVQKGSWVWDTRVASPMSRYPRFASRRADWIYPLGQVMVRVRTDTGLQGFGIGGGGKLAATVVAEHFRMLLLGEDPGDPEALWEILYRASLPYGRKGAPVMAISAVDIALWDLLSKSLGVPLYKALGSEGPVPVAAYATGNDPEWYVALGFPHVKVAMPCGPPDGPDGLEANVALVRQAREAAGPDARVMVDCFMAWDAEYTVRAAERMAPYGVYWIEEPLPPDDLSGYAQLRKRELGPRIACGEREYTRWGFQTLIDYGAADVLQPDVCWAGGISETMNICRLAASHGIPVCPHNGGNQPWTVHLMSAAPGCEMAEVLVPQHRGVKAPPAAARLEGGALRPDDAPGAGTEPAPGVLLQLEWW